MKAPISLGVLLEACNGVRRTAGQEPAAPGWERRQRDGTPTAPATPGKYRQLPADCWNKLQTVTGEKRNEQNWIVSQRQEKRSKPLRSASSFTRAVGVVGARGVPARC